MSVEVTEMTKALLGSGGWVAGGSLIRQEWLGRVISCSYPPMECSDTVWEGWWVVTILSLQFLASCICSFFLFQMTYKNYKCILYTSYSVKLLSIYLLCCKIEIKHQHMMLAICCIIITIYMSFLKILPL